MDKKWDAPYWENNYFALSNAIVYLLQKKGYTHEQSIDFIVQAIRKKEDYL